MQKIYEEIMRLHSHQTYPIYPTFNDIFDFVHLTHKKKKKKKGIHCVKIHKKLRDKMKTFLGFPMELSRLMASLEELEINLEELKNIINCLPIPFIFNLDEFGQQD